MREITTTEAEDGREASSYEDVSSWQLDQKGILLVNDHKSSDQINQLHSVYSLHLTI